MQSSFQFAIAAQFDNDNLVDAEAHEVERLVGLFLFVHIGRCVQVGVEESPTAFTWSE